jgi:1-acyl-sn-glycerol-3-phosphate acyltransferase
MRWLLTPLLWVALLFMLSILGAMSVAWNSTALLLYPLLPRPVGLRVGRAVIAWGYGAFWQMAAWSGMMRLDSKALDVLRHEPGGLIVVANHPSLLDAVMLVARLPRSVCVMKASLIHNPLLGPGALLARYILNDTPSGLVRRAVEDLKQGGQLVLFPEGTRTTQVPLNPFRPGLTLIAKMANVPIQTVFIDTCSPYLRKGWPLWRLPPLPILFSVRLGQRFAPQADHVALLAEIESYFAAGVCRTEP